ncbi:MAG: ferritin-like domain-containing protein [Acidobacteria bacterium]|nr:ferritin-like domain-containing protein [Acidobacteriota bacterium]
MIEERGDLTDVEKRLIEKSIATFQLGEYSEGKGLLRAAEIFARQVDNEELVKITRLFIAEEQNHAMLLQRFMAMNSIRPLKKHWADSVFRGLRKGVGFELSVTVLITAEIISLVYYKALSASTNSRQLQAICGKILSDETGHVEYESELLKYIRNKKPRLQKRVVEILHGILFSGTVIVVYHGHRKVLIAGGYDFNRFRQACWAEFSSCFYSKSPSQATVSACR